MPERMRESLQAGGWIDKLPDILHFALALVLVVGILITYAMTGQVPEVLAFTLTSVVGYYFGRSNRRGS